MIAMLLAVPGQAQDQPQATRKVLVRITPSYPELARKAYLSGTIRVVATVAPDGRVKATKALGGNPVLIDAAEQALEKWKWAAAPTDTQEIIEMSFHP